MNTRQVEFSLWSYIIPVHSMQIRLKSELAVSEVKTVRERLCAVTWTLWKQLEPSASVIPTQVSKQGRCFRWCISLTNYNEKSHLRASSQLFSKDSFTMVKWCRTASANILHCKEKNSSRCHLVRSERYSRKRFKTSSNTDLPSHKTNFEAKNAKHAC